MPHTSCKVHMEFSDTTARADSSLSSADNAPIGNLRLMKEKETYPVYAIPDLNSFLLDGSREIMDYKSELPFVSSDVSSEDCIYDSPPGFVVDFTVPHTSAGITFWFTGDYPAEMKVTWYGMGGEKLVSGNYYPDSGAYFCRKQVENYGKVEVRFIRSRLPGQRIQCTYILYGVELEWNGENIKSASVTEEVDVTGTTAPVNTAEVSIIDETNDFELSNEAGVWKSIQKRQEVTFTEEAGGQEIPCGTFYIDTWKSDGSTVSFSLIDRLGVIDRTKFYDGQMYDGVTARKVIESIMLSAGVEDYTVAEDVGEVRLTGHIPICTHREALQQVIFACGAVADCSRSGGIKIYRPGRQARSIIGTDRKFMGTTMEMAEYVSGISLSYSRFTLKEEREDAFNDILPAGINLVEFSEPYTNITVSSGNIKASGANYVSVEMEEEGACVISGNKYEAGEVTHTERVPILDAGEEENILTFSGCTLLSAELAKEAAKRLLNFYQLRQVVTFRYLLDKEKTGDWVNIMDTSGNKVVSGITRQAIDLTGGFIAEASSRGYSREVTDYSYCGEILTGERGLI